MCTAEREKRKRYNVMLDPMVRKEVRKIAADRELNFSDTVNRLLLAGIAVSGTLAFTPSDPAA